MHDCQRLGQRRVESSGCALQPPSLFEWSARGIGRRLFSLLDTVGMGSPATYEEIRDIARRAVVVLRTHGYQCCLFGSAACALYGVSRCPKVCTMCSPEWPHSIVLKSTRTSISLSSGARTPRTTSNCSQTRATPFFLPLRGNATPTTRYCGTGYPLLLEVRVGDVKSTSSSLAS